MGSSPSSNQRRDSQAPPAALPHTKLPPDAARMLVKCLKVLPFPWDEVSQNSAVKNAELKEITAPGTLMRKGDESLGIHVLVSGSVQVVSEDERFVFRNLHPGECFGEVAQMFGKKCTANVRVDDRCTLVLLSAEILQSLFPSAPEVHMLDWCCRRRYLDTGKLFKDQELMRTVALDVLREVPLFHAWSAESLKALLETMRKDIIVLYPSGSVISREGCLAQEAFILVHGRVAFSSGEQELGVFDAGERGFCFGEEGLFVNSERRTSARALTPCQVITIHPENLHDIVNQFPTESSLLRELNRKWAEHVESRDKALLEKYGGGLDMEILRMALKQTSVFKDCPPGFLYIVALSMVVHEIADGDPVLSETQYLGGEILFIVLQGAAVVMDKQQPTEHSLELNQVFWKTTDMPERGWVKAADLCVVAHFPEIAVTEAEDAFPDVHL